MMQVTPTQMRLHLEHRARLVRLRPTVPSKVLPIVVPTPMPMLAPTAEPQKVLPAWKLTPSQEQQLLAFDALTHPITRIQNIVAKHFNLRVRDLLGTSRRYPVVLPRHIAIYLAKRLTERSLPEIGRRFGGRDHTTVLNALRKIGDKVERDPDFASQVEAIADKVRAE